jgi:3-hydroxyacyl-CoA dehydrogenase
VPEISIVGGVMNYRQIAVIGAGAMGSGIAHAFAAASIDVILSDVTSDLVAQGLKRIEARCLSDVKKGKLTPEASDALMGRIKGSADRTDARSADLVIEAIVEERRTKGDLFRSLDRICSPESVLATNTSTLSVTDLACLSGRPDRFLGLHFFNPVHAMKLVEVIPGLDTDASVVSRAKEAMGAIGKVPIVAQDCPGFLVNRILLTYITEALLCAEEGISPEEIDEKARQAGFPMGPLALVDMVGIDVSCHTQPVLHEAYGVRYPYPGIVQRLFDAGRLGAKTGKGIYGEGTIDDEFRRIVGRVASGPFSIDRCIARAVNEAVYCLQEGVASPEEIDRAMVLGTGFPEGGPLHWADARGLDGVVSMLEQLSGDKGPRFWPHHLLKTYVAGGRRGKKAKKGFFDYPHPGE